MKRKAYESDAVPFSIKEEKYRESNMEYTYIIESKNLQGYIELKDILDFVTSDDPNTKYVTPNKKLDYFPTKKFKITIDKNQVIKNNVLTKENYDKIIPAIEWNFKGSGVMKSQLMVLDLLANNNWTRPIYFAITTGPEAYMGLEPYFQLEGLAYKFIPVKDTTFEAGQTGTINTKEMYNNLMNKFKWGNMNDPRVYLDETNRRMTMNFRNNFARLADALIKEGKNDSALAVVKRCEEVMPENTVPYEYFMTQIAEIYYRLGKIQHANEIMKKIKKVYELELKYYFSFDAKRGKQLDYEKQRGLSILNRMANIAKMNKQDAFSKEIEASFNKYYSQYAGTQEGGMKQIE